MRLLLQATAPMIPLVFFMLNGQGLEFPGKIRKGLGFYAKLAKA